MNTMVRLAVMMFLEYVIWGSWLPLANNYFEKLGFNATDRSWFMNAFPLASLITIMIGGQIADRFLAGEKVLALCHLIGGVAMLLIPSADGFWGIFLLMLAHCVFYAPTMAVTNAIAFAHVSERATGFARVRLWGTIGWIAASVPMLLLLSGEKLGTKELGNIFTVAGVASVMLAAFSLALPHTPPTRVGEGGARSENTIGLALGLLSNPVIFVLFLTTVADTVVHTAYFNFTGRFLEHLGLAPKYIMSAMSVGQIAEILTMAILGFCLKRLGWRTTMTLGILGHGLRFFVFWLGTPDLLPLVIAINVVHGICYAFFFATVFIFIDEYVPKDIRNSAQGLFNVAVLGVGQLIGFYLWGQVEGHFTDPVTKKLDYPSVFMVATTIAVSTALFFLLFFHPKQKAPGEVPTVE